MDTKVSRNRLQSVTQFRKRVTIFTH